MLLCNHNFIRHKVDLLNLAEDFGDVSKACQIICTSYSPDYKRPSMSVLVKGSRMPSATRLCGCHGRQASEKPPSRKPRAG